PCLPRLRNPMPLRQLLQRHCEDRRRRTQWHPTRRGEQWRRVDTERQGLGGAVGETLSVLAVRGPCGLTFEFTRVRKRAKPAVALRVQRRVRPRAHLLASPSVPLSC